MGIGTLNGMAFVGRIQHSTLQTSASCVLKQKMLVFSKGCKLAEVFSSLGCTWPAIWVVANTTQ